MFMSQLSETNVKLDMLVDFNKVSQNVNRISLKLNQLNYLIGKTDMRQAVCDIYDENPKAFEVLGILVAVREDKLVLDNLLVPKLTSAFFEDVDGVCQFIDNTGLAELFSSCQISNLVDYVFGVEVGLDTNARKNRGGEAMASIVASKFEAEGVKFDTEVNSTAIGVTTLGVDLKRFDFVVRTKTKTFLIETNYYNGGGSKLNETARAYSELAPRINQCPQYEFVWITDGKGWYSARNKLQEAYNTIPRLYNLTTINEFIEEVKALQ